MDVLEKEQLNFEEARRHWYYLSKYQVMKKAIEAMKLPEKPNLADFGCGAGLFLSMIVEDGLFSRSDLVGVDTAYPSEGILPESGVRVVPLFPAGCKFDVILLMDVLEHIADASSALQHVTEHCKPGGYLFVTLPAMMMFWSPHDQYLGHQKRYHLTDFQKLVDQIGGLKIENLFYYFASILPVAGPLRWFRRLGFQRKGSDMRPTIPSVNRWLTTLLAWEQGWMSGNRWAGLSVIAVCRKLK